MACKRCGLPLDPLSGDVDRHPIGSCVVQLVGEVDQLRSEVQKLHDILKDPVAVALNMKRGFIALPTELHWETENETVLRTENERLRGELAEWQTAVTNAYGGPDHDDELHCGCVPLLRMEVKRLRAELQAYKDAPTIDLSEGDEPTILIR